MSVVLIDGGSENFSIPASLSGRPLKRVKYRAIGMPSYWAILTIIPGLNLKQLLHKESLLRLRSLMKVLLPLSSSQVPRKARGEQSDTLLF
jgi:hypothetical protein